ncbi:ADC synthase [Cyathus striatus]|nr:ADC synthase [Cyathus striatus]
MTFDFPRILFIDSYDSFTYNLAALCRQSIPNCSLYIIKNDQFTIDQLRHYLRYFSAIIVGPGPGSPDVQDDIGVIKDIWHLDEQFVLPIFGVCLGLQSLGLEFGALIKRLNTVKHGQISPIFHTGIDIFREVDSVKAVRYHSLCIELTSTDFLEELAWANDEENGRVVMGIKHKTLPFWAVQYHPESVRTHGGGEEVLTNFWRLAQSWSRIHDRSVSHWDSTAQSKFSSPWPYTGISSPFISSSPSTRVTTTKLHAPNLSIVTICEGMGVQDESSPFVLLDSAAVPGRFSIMAALPFDCLRITYSLHDLFVRLIRGSSVICEELGSHDIWDWLRAFIRERKADGGHPDIPFWGGLIGHLSYELGVHSLGVSSEPLRREFSRHPDVNLVFVERSVVVDTSTGDVFVQSLLPRDETWISATCLKLKRLQNDFTNMKLTEKKPSGTSIALPVISMPNKNHYIRSVNRAKEHLFAGDSYELCLTGQTKVSFPPGSHLPSWTRYRLLRRSNPAPYSAYLRLHPTTFLSSSPERFLSFTRPPGSTCQLRPIKGTIQKRDGITRTIAEQALTGSAKEVAENLMIVDLIRHDLHSVIGENVQVTQFCKVEEYQTVWQLVSVVEGTKRSTPLTNDAGISVLQATLPPGSMTGAPKKRSVEILQTLEGGERGIYSGVVGYLCVGGGGDWSVTIRSCFKYAESETIPEHSNREEDCEEWLIGAGGAITALSDAEAEWDEMIVKLQSVLGSFRK